jgi:hypothetical protein
MVLILMNAHLKARAALFYPGRCLASVFLDQAPNIADAPAFGDDPRLSDNPGGQLSNFRYPLCESSIWPSNLSLVPNARDRQPNCLFEANNT